MKHATPEGLKRIQDFLDELSSLADLTARKDFHEDGQRLFADVRLDDEWDRFCVDSREQQKRLINSIREHLSR